MSIKHVNLCDRISVGALSATLILGIIAFMPGGLIPAMALKGYLLVVGVLVAFVAWLVARLIEGSFHIPWTPVLLSGGAVVVSLLLSSIFSHTSYLAFFGEGFDLGTFAILGSLFLAVFLASMQFTTRHRVFRFIQVFLGIYLIVALYQLVHIFIPSWTSFGVFFNRADTPAGYWNDFAFLSGGALLGFMLLLQFARMPRRIKIVSYVGAALSLFFVILTNIYMVWVLVGLSAVVILVYTLLMNRMAENRPFPFLAFILSLVALAFILANSLIGSLLANALNVNFIDVHPNVGSTLHVAGLSLSQNPIFGSGPNTFFGEWMKFRPIEVNNHVLWDTQFSAGVSFLGSVAFLGGAIGILAMLLFVFMYLYEGVGKVFKNNISPEQNLFVFGLFLVSLYFVLGSTLYAPGMPVVLAAFLLIGVFIGALISEQRIPVKTVNFLRDTRAGFFSILSIVALLMVSAGTAYAATQRFAAIVFFERGLSSLNAGDLDRANSRLGQAIALADMPVFQRARVLVAQRSIQNTMNSSSSASSDQVRATLQNAVSLGNGAARQAIALDSTDPANYLALGDLLRMIAPLKVEGAFDAAKQAYESAIKLVPAYPKPYLMMAELYYEGGDNQNARAYIEKALAAKQNYTAAYFLLAQVEVASGNTGTAIKRLQDATIIDPNNPDVYFELGLLRYQSGSYNDAISAFRQAIALNPQYLNAWYYLALADQKIGATTEATGILTALHNKFPDNGNIANALNKGSSTSDDSSIAAPAASTKGSTKEKAKKLPVPESAKQ